MGVERVDYSSDDEYRQAQQMEEWQEQKWQEQKWQEEQDAKEMEARMIAEEQAKESVPAETLVIRIAEVCQKEIKWVNDCLEENEQKKNYTAEDIIYLPAYKKGFETILTIIGNSVQRRGFLAACGNIYKFN